MALFSTTSNKLPKKSAEKSAEKPQKNSAKKPAAKPVKKPATKTPAKTAEEKKAAKTPALEAAARGKNLQAAAVRALKTFRLAREKTAQARAVRRPKKDNTKQEEQENAQIRAYLTDPLDLFAKRGARASASLSSRLSFGRAAAAKPRAPQADAPSITGASISATTSTSTSTSPPASNAQKTHKAAPAKQSLLSPAAASGGRHEITVKDLHKHFGKKHAVNGISFNIFSGEVVGFLGPNGAGKTTVFYMIVGFLKPNKGSILFDGTDVTKFPMYKRAQAGISYLPQEASVFRQLSVEKNIMAVLQTVRSLSGAERKKRLDFLLDEFGLTALRRQKAYTLSGGERRRTEIARGMALNPKFLLLDEPFTGIDPKARYELKQIIASLAQQNVGVLITDHNERDTLSITNRAFIVHDGHIVAAGSHDEIMRNVKVREIYLGENYS